MAGIADHSQGTQQRYYMQQGASNNRQHKLMKPLQNLRHDSLRKLPDAHVKKESLPP